MAPPRHGRRPGLREVVLLWTLYAVVAAEVFATYSRLPVHELYHVSGNGREGGAARALVFLNWPVALAAIPMLAILAASAQRPWISRLAVVAAILCCGVFWPGMVDQADLDAKWANGVAALGVLLAACLTLWVLLANGLGPRTRVAWDRTRIVVTAVLALVALPWLFADLGFLIGRLPLLGSIYYSDEWWAPFGHARLHRAVHAGNHHGLVGALLVVTALLLSRPLAALSSRLRAFVGAYLAVLSLYGVANIANDFWLEQVVKRDITHWELPSMTTPAPTLAWLILLLAATLLYVLVLRGLRRPRPVGDGLPLTSFLAVPVIVGLLAVGLAHGSSAGHTHLAIADGIVFAAAPHGASHLFVTRGSRIVQLTSGHGSDLAPAWSPDRRELAFQSNRDGNWEIYVMRANGGNVRRLTHDGARDGEPGWSSDGRRVVFTRDGRLYEIDRHGRGLRPLGRRGDWPTWSRGNVLATGDRRPSWSPTADLLTLECRVGSHWHVCVTNADGSGVRYLTPHSSDAFAPSWSPDGRMIAFVSDRDGPDELYVMRADGTRVSRITSGTVDVDTPTWARR